MRGTAMGTAERKEMQRDGELMGETRDISDDYRYRPDRATNHDASRESPYLQTARRFDITDISSMRREGVVIVIVVVIVVDDVWRAEVRREREREKR